MHYFFLQVANGTSKGIVDYFPLFGPIIIILTFTIDRIIAFHIRKREQERSWYMKAVIEPNIEHVEKFYDNVLSIFNKSYISLSVAKNGDTLVYKKKQAKANEEFQDIKRKFEYQFVLLAESSSPMLFGEITSIVQDLEDNFVTYLDSARSVNDIATEFRNSMATNKGNLYQKLYIPLVRRTHKRSLIDSFLSRIKFGGKKNKL